MKTSLSMLSLSLFLFRGIFVIEIPPATTWVCRWMEELGKGRSGEGGRSGGRGRKDGGRRGWRGSAKRKVL